MKHHDPIPVKIVNSLLEDGEPGASELEKFVNDIGADFDWYDSDDGGAAFGNLKDAGMVMVSREEPGKFKVYVTFEDDSDHDFIVTSPEDFKAQLAAFDRDEPDISAQVEEQFSDDCVDNVDEIETKPAYLSHMIALLSPKIADKFSVKLDKAKELARDVASAVWDMHHE